MPTTSPQPLDRIRAVAERVAHSYGLDVFDVQFRRESPGWVVRIVLDRPEDPAPGDGPAVQEAGIGVEECERVSRDVSAILDVEDVIDRRYTLEVSSPGLDRPLRERRDYSRFAGRLVRVVASEAIDNQTFFRGRLEGLEGDTVVLVTGAGKRHRIPLGLIERARLDVEF